MKIEVLRPVDYRIAPAVIQAFPVGFHDVPKATADALIASGAAIPANSKPSKED